MGEFLWNFPSNENLYSSPMDELMGAGVVSGAGQYSSMRKGTLGASSTRRCDTQLNRLVQY